MCRIIDKNQQVTPLPHAQGTITFVRHGQSVYNHAELHERIHNYFRDAPLSSLGRHQAIKLRKRLRAEYFNSILVSPLARARETARLCLSEHHPTPLICASCSEWMMAPVDVPLSARYINEILSYDSVHINADIPPPVKKAMSSLNNDKDLQKFHLSWFEEMGLSRESPENFTARVEALRARLILNTLGNVLVIGHARIFSALLNNLSFSNAGVQSFSREYLESMVGESPKHEALT